MPKWGFAAGASDLVENAVLPLDACEGEELVGALMVVGAEVEQVCDNCCPRTEVPVHDKLAESSSAVHCTGAKAVTRLARHPGMQVPCSESCQLPHLHVRCWREDHVHAHGCMRTHAGEEGFRMCVGQAGAVDALLFRCRGRPAVLLNAEWGAAGALPERHAALAASFDVVYCFEPIAVRVRSAALGPGGV